MNILITGAGRGLGFQLTKQAVERGYRVVACVRDVTDVSIDLSALAKKASDQVRVVQLNVASEDEAAQLAAKLQEEAWKLDGVINNAGIILDRHHKLATLPLSSVKTNFEVNLIGPMNVIKHMAPLVSEHSGAMVLNISSEAGSVTSAYGGDYPYALSKNALNMFSKMVGSELHSRGIRVLAIHPGWIKTDMGGENAPLTADVSANGILDLLEMKTAVAEELYFVDYMGRAMPI
jgi:NAD(P)-dependent dehydrogenase (short-subunit alcohol dehydrogenase family)